MISVALGFQLRHADTSAHQVQTLGCVVVTTRCVEKGKAVGCWGSVITCFTMFVLLQHGVFKTFAKKIIHPTIIQPSVLLKSPLAFFLHARTFPQGLPIGLEVWPWRCLAFHGTLGRKMSENLLKFLSLISTP